MNHLVPYLERIEVVELQALNNWMYDEGVGRVQRALALREPVYFADFNGEYDPNKIYEIEPRHMTLKSLPVYHTFTSDSDTPSKVIRHNDWICCQMPLRRLF